MKFHYSHHEYSQHLTVVKFFRGPCSIVSPFMSMFQFPLIINFILVKNKKPHTIVNPK